MKEELLVPGKNLDFEVRRSLFDFHLNREKKA